LKINYRLKRGDVEMEILLWAIGILVSVGLTYWGIRAGKKTPPVVITPPPPPVQEKPRLPAEIPSPPTPYFAHPYPLQANFTGRVKEREDLTN
jgi:hypothetical protein